MSTIPQLLALRKRLNELNLQKARYGISADPHISIEVEDLSTLVGQMERIDIHRRNLDHTLQQRDHFGPNVPTHIVNQIMSERAAIIQLRNACARLGQNVPAHPVDDDEQPELPPIPAPSIPRQQPADIRAKLDQIEQLINEIRQALN